MNKPSQKELCWALLQENTHRYMSAYEFVGEKMIDGIWHLLSYKSPARLSDLFNEGLVERRQVTGKSGAKYYAYKIIK